MHIPQFPVRAIALLFCACAPCAAGTEIQEDASGVIVDVQDSRPLAKVADVLASRYSYPVSYEDPPYAYGDDLRDVSQVVRQAGAAARNRPVLVPAGGNLHVRSDGTVTDAASLAILLERIVAAHNESGVGSRFTIQSTRQMFHIIPTSARDTSGEWKAIRPVLSQNIELAAQKKTRAGDRIRELIQKVSEASGQDIDIGLLPSKAIQEVRDYPGATGTARDLLVDILSKMDGQLTWRLLYAPDLQRYYLSVVGGSRVAASTPVQVPATQERGMLGTPPNSR